MKGDGSTREMEITQFLRSVVKVTPWYKYVVVKASTLMLGH